jgi:hypothetical protein
VPARLLLYFFMGAAVVILAVAVATLYSLYARGPQARGGPPVTQDAAKEQIGALTQALVGNQVELARKKLEDKNYAAAVAQAERALKLDPQSAPAKQILNDAQTSLRDLEAAAAEARAGLKAKDTERASGALWKILAIDPNYPAAEELARSLDRPFRARAEEARRLMSESRGAAERAKAGSLEPFTDAAAVARGGDALLASKEFAQAARKFLDARDGFDRARRFVQH